MASTLLKAQYGDLRLYVSQVETDVGRSLVVHEPSQGDLYTVQDRGQRQDRTRCDVVFCHIPSEADDHITRYKAFKSLVDDGEPQIFVHPLHGSYLAAIGDCRMSTADDGTISISVEFIALEEPAAVLDELAAGVAPTAGPEAVALEVTKTNEALTDAGLTSTVPTSTGTTVEAWGDLDLDEEGRQIYVEASSLIDSIDAEIDRLELASDLSRWTAYVRMVTLRDRVRSCAEAMTQVATQVFELVVQVETPLIVICAQTYGADQAETRTREVRQLNDLRDPGLVASGTTLKMPVAGGRP